MTMKNLATRLFVYSSIAFGIIGILMVLTSPGPGGTSSEINIMFEKLLLVAVFIILPSFALSVASKYFNGKS